MRFSSLFAVNKFSRIPISEKTKTAMPKNSEMVFSEIFGSYNWVSRKIKNYMAQILKLFFGSSFLVSLPFH